MESIITSLGTHWSTMLAMALGVSIHIAKKAGEAYQKDKTFDLSDYLLGHPYQTYAAAGMTIGSYLQLVSDPATPVTLFGAFLAGVASNALADIFPGSRS